MHTKYILSNLYKFCVSIMYKTVACRCGNKTATTLNQRHCADFILLRNEIHKTLITCTKIINITLTICTQHIYRHKFEDLHNNTDIRW